MKVKLLLGIAVVVLLFSSCKKDEELAPTTTQVKVKIDYLGSGGYYNDNIDGIPNGLVIGTNGPFTVSTTRSYTLVYKANSNFPETSIASWTPTTGRTWVIHCYVLGNYEHIETYPE